ncbi:MAG: YggS family pyridoxal phosphate-dependent enzyme [Ignavibacteria bacterium]|nr:YggS family pyridoxal phosphate-dependent enzyme [Ignavibacteria bacterium]
MIKENLNRVREEIAEKCIKIGRNPAEITLIAVSKTYGYESVLKAVNCGQKDFGENWAQELVEKYDFVPKDVSWHFIGHLQTNKAKYVVPRAEFIHSVDKLKLAEEIAKIAQKQNKLQKILLEIKTSEEATKHGLTSEKEIEEIAGFCKENPNINLVGLMTMAPFTDDEKKVSQSFVQLRLLKDQLNGKGFGLKELSMGMTGDFELALEEGATMLRIGTAIFGTRNYST